MSPGSESIIPCQQARTRRHGFGKATDGINLRPFADDTYSILSDAMQTASNVTQSRIRLMLERSRSNLNPPICPWVIRIALYRRISLIFYVASIHRVNLTSGLRKCYIGK